MFGDYHRAGMCNFFAKFLCYHFKLKKAILKLRLLTQFYALSYL